MAPQHHEDLSQSMRAFESAIESFALDNLSQFLLRLLRNGKISPFNLIAACTAALEDFSLPNSISIMLNQVQSEIGKAYSHSDASEESEESDEPT